jgi:predicted house-cleaning noncanonical NTP pyrophosphatase (MazG superfamily)
LYLPDSKKRNGRKSYFDAGNISGRGGRTVTDVIRYDKLVRDKIPSIIEASGKTAVTDRIPPENMPAALDRKLQEEVKEFLESHSVEEMADVLEVFHGIAFHFVHIDSSEGI